MNTKFTLALLASAVMGRGIANSNQSEFQDYIGTFGKNYSSVDEMVNRMTVWMENKRTVD